MFFYKAAIVAAIALEARCAHFNIPEVSNIVNDVLVQFSDVVHFDGNETYTTNPTDIQQRDVLSRDASSFWMESIAHQGVSAFGSSGYQIFRNVKDFGAKGDGVTDDTNAINLAMNSGGRCGQGCASSTTTPAVVYFPSGTYLISSSIIDQYYTQIIGNPNSLPILKASPNFSGFGLIDGDKYYTANLNWGSTNVFNRQVRNLVFDLTGLPTGSNVAGIHWPTSQATSLTNLVFQMSSASGTQHVGIFSESGSAGYMGDLTFNGGNFGMQIGNQQFSMRNLVFNNVVTAITHFWSWGWLYQGITINNCGTGIDISAGGSTAQAVGSITIIDSVITNTPTFIVTAFDSTSKPTTAGSLILENVVLNNVGTAVKQAGGGTLLAGTTGSTTIAGWGQGNKYTPTGPTRFQASFSASTRPASLLNGNVYYTRSKPQYNTLPVSSFVSARSSGATGNGQTDDTAKLQAAINAAASAGKVLYLDAGTYKVTSTLLIPAGSKIVGETYPVIMSSGSFFNQESSPQPVVKVGTAGQSGQVEWTDTIVGTQGQQAGAIAIEWNLASAGTPSGMWDVHVRIGGFAGSNLQVAQCPTTGATVNLQCVGAYMLMHVTPSASGLYMENVWLWTADHDIDSQSNTQITIYSGRGLYVESTVGNIWMVGTSVEHNTLYQYQLANTQNIFMGFVQTETPYYQPSPIAPTPWTIVPVLNDPDFATSCAGASGNCAMAWGLRILDSHSINIYGAGLYSFFNYYSTECCAAGGPENCQNNIFSLEGALSDIYVYTLATVGTQNMIVEHGTTLAKYSDNLNVFTDLLTLFTSGVVAGDATAAGPGSGDSGGSGGSSGTGSSTGIGTSTSSATSASSAASTASATPSSSWEYLGCYTDSISARSLGHGVGVPGGASQMTVEACTAVCQASGYTLSGVEYSGECYCDNALQNGGAIAAPSGCNMACNGAPSEICGGSNRLSLYEHNTTADSGGGTGSTNLQVWNFKGCYTDSVTARTLSQRLEGGSTIEGCQSACKAMGYVYSGVEYASECYCDSTLRNGGAPAADGNALCNMACSGNTTETCGGPDRLDLYTYGF